MRHKGSIFHYLHILLPLLAGALIYILFSKDVYFVKFLPVPIMEAGALEPYMLNNPFLKILRNYVPDILWGYALVFALFQAMDNNTADINKVLFVAALFSVVMELLQLSSKVKGTFDVLDIAVMLVAEVFAVFIIKKYLGGN